MDHIYRAGCWNLPHIFSSYVEASIGNVLTGHFSTLNNIVERTNTFSFFFVLDDDTVAVDLSKRVRVLCFVMTCPERLDSKASHVKATWGSRCNKVLYVSDYLNTTFPTINITVDHGRKYLTAKTMAAFDYIYKHHLNDADWFMKADDDTYVIMENLRYFLSEQDTNKPLLFGSHFMLGTAMGSMSGGAG